MGNAGSLGAHHRRRHGGHPLPPPSHPPQPEINGNRYVFAAVTPYPAQYPNTNPPPYYPHSAFNAQPPVPLPPPLDHQPHRGVGRPQMYPPALPSRYPCGPAPPPQTAFVEHQKAVTIRNDVNLKKETLRVEPDEEDPRRYLVSFTFDATADGSITLMFFAKEGTDCNLTSTHENLEPVTISFRKGLGQKFRQPSGTGINFSMFEESELMKVGDIGEVYPLAVKAEATPSENNGSDGENPVSGTLNSQITQAVFEKKDQGNYHVKVVKQILWVNNMRYELQEIYGIGNSVDSDFDENDPGKECVICLSEPRDTTVLPCRHMCMCSGCAKVLRFQTNRCPICRQPVERLLEIKVSEAREGIKSTGLVDNDVASSTQEG